MSVKPTLQQYVADLAENDLWSIVDSYEKFEADGFIAAAPIRVHAEAYMRLLGVNAHVTTWMRELAFGCYRRLALAGRRGR
jgi:hypothetical protein